MRADSIGPLEEGALLRRRRSELDENKIGKATAAREQERVRRKAHTRSVREDSTRT
jgi:hypothetical protein